MTSTLTSKQRAFANYIADGLNQSEAYRKAYGGRPNFTTTKREAHAVRHNPKVAAEIDRLTAKHDKKQHLTREAKRRILREIVEDKNSKDSDRLKAIEIDNIMTGDNAPQQVNVFGLSELLAMVRSQGPN